MTDLLKLADHCETAPGPAFALDRAISDAMGHGAELIRNYSASVDTAMSLVPEDAAMRLYRWPRQTDNARVCVLIEGGQETWAATPALALCAAALRARAS